MAAGFDRKAKDAGKLQGLESALILSWRMVQKLGQLEMNQISESRSIVSMWWTSVRIGQEVSSIGADTPILHYWGTLTFGDGSKE